MTVAFRIMAFVLLFNIAAGILNVALIDYFPDGVPTGYQYNESANYANEFDGSVAAPGAESDSGWWDKFIDFLRIGFFEKIRNILDKSVYGIIGIFKDIGILNPVYESYIRGIITIIYMIGIVDLFTGKKVTY